MSRSTTNEKIHKRPAVVAAPDAEASLTLGDRIYLKFGWPVVRTVHLVASGVAYALVLLLDYLIVLFTAVQVVPNIAATIQRGTGITLEAGIESVIAGWIIPVLFIVAALLVGEVFAMRRLWRFTSAHLFALSGWLFRLEMQKRFGADVMPKETSSWGALYVSAARGAA